MAKKVVLLLLAVVLSACSVVGTNKDECGPKFVDEKHAFVVSAFGIEDAAIKSHVTILDTCTHEDVIYNLAKYDNREIVIYESGYGVTKSELTTEKTLKFFKGEVEVLVFSGIAGGIDPNLKIGDTVVPEKWYELSTGQWTRVDKDLLKLAKKIPETSISFPESGITSSEYVSDKDVVEHITKNYGASVVDMETYEVAIVAHNMFIPFIAFRTVSDYADGVKDKSHYQEAAEASANNAFAFLDIYFSQNQAP